MSVEGRKLAVLVQTQYENMRSQDIRDPEVLRFGLTCLKEQADRVLAERQAKQEVES